MTFWKRQNLQKVNRSVAVRGWGGGEKRTGAARKTFQGSKTTLYDTLTVGARLIHFSKPTECTPPRVNPNVNAGLRVTITHPCRFINCDKGTIWERVLIMGEALDVAG